jgi:hypothetical protein
MLNTYIYAVIHTNNNVALGLKYLLQICENANKSKDRKI